MLDSLTKFSPLTGGHQLDSFEISFAPLSLAEAYQLAENPANGAIVMMSGTVRQQTDSKSVLSLEYQAYEPMALAIFRQIAAHIRQQWSDVNPVIIHHRIGRLAVGEISVLVAVGSPHRQEAFAACCYAIDTLKHQAPIWKKEYWADGSSNWVSVGACEGNLNNCEAKLGSNNPEYGQRARKSKERRKNDFQKGLPPPQ